MTILLVNVMGYRSRPSCRRPVPLFSLPTLDKRPTGEKACPTNIFVKAHQKESAHEKSEKSRKEWREQDCTKTSTACAKSEKSRKCQKPMQNPRLHNNVNCLCKRCPKIPRRQPCQRTDETIMHKCQEPTHIPALGTCLAEIMKMKILNIHEQI